MSNEKSFSELKKYKDRNYIINNEEDFKTKLSPAIYALYIDLLGQLNAEKFCRTASEKFLKEKFHNFYVNLHTLEIANTLFQLKWSIYALRTENGHMIFFEIL